MLIYEMYARSELFSTILRGHRDRDCIIVRFITTYAISAYSHYRIVSSNPFQARGTQYNIM